MRATLRQALLADPALAEAIPAERWIQRGSILPGKVPERPFAIIAGAGDDPELFPSEESDTLVDNAEIWVHDDPGTYLYIDEVIRLIRLRSKRVVHFEYDGWRISQMRSQGAGPDLQDDMFRTVTRSLRLRVVGRRLVA